MALALVLVPLALALLASMVGSPAWRGRILPLAGSAHLALTVLALRTPDVGALEGWLHLDSVGRLVLGFCSVLYFFTSLYAPGYLASHPERPNRLFC
ncbi:MAG TPA: hypothetical protein VIF09_14840, partial [Polyangiaceae bacterium]